MVCWSDSLAKTLLQIRTGKGQARGSTKIVIITWTDLYIQQAKESPDRNPGIYFPHSARPDTGMKKEKEGFGG